MRLLPIFCSCLRSSTLRISSTSLPRVSLPETSPTLRWTGKVGDVSVFRVWGSCAFVRDMSTDKLSARAIPCIFLGFTPDAPGWQFYYPTSRRIFPSQDVTFDESILFYHLFPYRSAPPRPPPLFLAPGPPPVDPLPTQGPAHSGVSQVDPLLGTAPVEVVVGSDAASGGAASRGVEPGVVESEGEEPGNAERVGVEPGGVELEGAESGGAEPQGAALSGGPAGAGAAGGAGVTARAGGTGGTAATRHGGARTHGTGAAGTSGVGGAGAGDPTEPGAAGAGGSGASGAGAGGAGASGTGAGGAGAGGARVGVTGAGGARADGTDAGGAGSVVSLRLILSRVFPLLVAFLATSPTVSRLLATAVTDPSFESSAVSALVSELLDFAAACRLDYATAHVAESESPSPPSVWGEYALCTDVFEDMQEDFECLAVAVPRFASMLLTPEVDPDASDIPTPRSYAEAIAGFSQREGVDYFQTFSPTPKMTTLRVLLHVVAQCDYELHSLDFSTAFLQCSLYKEIWLRRPPRFTGSFPAGLHLRLFGLLFSTTGPSLFLRTDTALPPFYVLLYVLQCFGFQFFSPQPTPLSTSHSLGAPPLDESVEPSGPYPELVGCLITSGMGLVLGGRGPLQRGQLRLAYVATWANTADVFTKALPPGDHQRFVSVLGLLALLFLTGASASGTPPGTACQRSTSDPRLILGKGYWLVVLGGYGRTDLLLKQALLSQWSSDWESDMVFERSRVRIPVCALRASQCGGVSEVHCDWDLDTAPAEALHTFTLDSGASRCFFRDSTTLTPLPAPVPVRLADPFGGSVVARSSTFLASGSLSGLHCQTYML
ncbi:unnamed protein product [Closterium sp. NIES-53]